MEKISFKIVKNNPFKVKCDFHPDSQFLLINDNGNKIAWCLECLLKALGKHNLGQWNVVPTKEKS